jgi:hypothetical protein
MPLPATDKAIPFLQPNGALSGCHLRVEVRVALVTLSPRCSNLWTVFLRPGNQELDRFQQRVAELGQFALDSGRHHGVHQSRHEAVAFELAEREAQHSLADPVDFPP